MNLDGQPVYVGRPCGSRSLVLDRERVQRYTGALGVEEPLYEEVAPGLLLHSECYEDLTWYLANIWGNLHARQEWELFHAAPVGTAVRTHGFVRDRYRKRGRDYVVKETWVLDGDDTLLVRGLTHQSFLVSTETTSAAVDKSREKRGDRRFEIEARGRAVAPLEATVDEAMCMAFSGPGKNYHTDRESAQALGFPDIVVQGMLPVCFVSELLTRDFGRGWLEGGKMDVRLVNVLWAGETIRACAQSCDEVPEAGRTRVHLDVWVEKADGTKVVVGSASALR